MKKKSLTRMVIGAAGVLMTIALTACSTSAAAGGGSEGYAKDPDTLVFGVVPDSVDTETNYQPLMDYIAIMTGKTVEYHESTDYAALIEAAVAGKLDVASFSGFTYVIAKNQGAEITPISSIVTEEGAEPGYYSEAIVPVDSEIQTLSEFADKKVCFVDPSSTSGYLFPSYELLQVGIDVEADITAVFAGKHDVSVTKVGEGRECEAGFAEDSEVEKSDEVRVVNRTHVPGAPLVYSDALPEDVQQILVDALTEVTPDEMIAAGVEAAGESAFRSVFAGTAPTDDAAYQMIRDICEQTGAAQCEA